MFLQYYPHKQEPLQQWAALHRKELTTALAALRSALSYSPSLIIRFDQIDDLPDIRDIQGIGDSLDVAEVDTLPLTISQLTKRRVSHIGEQR